MSASLDAERVAALREVGTHAFGTPGSGDSRFLGYAAVNLLSDLVEPPFDGTGIEWEEDTRNVFGSASLFDDVAQSTVFGGELPVSRRHIVAADVAFLLGQVREALPYSEPEWRWLRGVWNEMERTELHRSTPDEDLDETRPGRIAQMQASSRLPGTPWHIDGHDLISRWSRWLNGTDANSAQHATAAHLALANITELVLPSKAEALAADPQLGPEDEAEGWGLLNRPYLTSRHVAVIEQARAQADAA